MRKPVVSERAKKRNSMLLNLILGPLFVVGGIFLLSDNGPVTCGGHVMTAGDTCQSKLYGVVPVGARSMDGQRTYERVASGVLIVFGLYAAGSGVRALIRQRKEGAASVAS
jgi:hypothetical protein